MFGRQVLILGLPRRAKARLRLLRTDAVGAAALLVKRIDSNKIGKRKNVSILKAGLKCGNISSENVPTHQ